MRMHHVVHTAVFHLHLTLIMSYYTKRSPLSDSLGLSMCKEWRSLGFDRRAFLMYYMLKDKSNAGPNFLPLLESSLHFSCSLQNWITLPNRSRINGSHFDKIRHIFSSWQRWYWYTTWDRASNEHQRFKTQKGLILCRTRQRHLVNSKLSPSDYRVYTIFNWVK